MGTFETPPVSTALSSIAFCQAAGVVVTQDGSVVGCGAATVVVGLAVGWSEPDPSEHAAAATVRTAIATATTTAYRHRCHTAAHSPTLEPAL